MAEKRSREDITADLSEKALAKLRREMSIVAQEVWVDDDHRVDFVGFRPARNESSASAIEHGTFVFVEVKSCMSDFKSGHGLTFEGDANWLVCPRELCEELRAKQERPLAASVVCPDAAGRLRTVIEAVGSDSPLRSRCASELLWRMVRHSAKLWRTSWIVLDGRDDQALQ